MCIVQKHREVIIMKKKVLKKKKKTHYALLTVSLGTVYFLRKNFVGKIYVKL